jgi:hypothetical protein
MSPTKQITIRVPIEVVARLNRQARNTAPYIVEAVLDKLSRDEEAEVVAAMQCLANDPEANDISDFAAAQDRVIVRGD